MTRTLLLTLLLLLPLLGCEGNALYDAELMDSPEGYEAFLAKYPDSAEASRLRTRIDELRFTRAKAEKSSQAMRDYLTHHPDGAYVDEARKLEDEIAHREAAHEHTPEAYRAYLDSHPDGAFVEEARFAHDQLTYLPQIAIQDIRVEPINMARDPKGPLNGWEIFAEVVNGGDRSLRTVEMAIDYLSATGNSVKSDKWWAVAPDLGGFPTPPEMKPTLHPQASRTFRWSTAEVPDGAQAANFGLRVTKVTFKQDD
ncbi:MAG: hypothetical protein GY898_34310 [Proteobacteria bacterium]|nr:hypothetical protein [Pseudomonadota bacterium]